MKIHSDTHPKSTSGLPSALSRLPSAISRLPSAVSRKPSTVSRLPSAVSRKPSTVSRLPSAVSRQPSTVSRLPSAVSRQPSTVSRLPSAVSRLPSAVNRQPSTVGRPPFIVLLLLFTFFQFGCEDYTSVPKPRAYPRVIYPEKAYKPFDETYCSFTFDQPVYATIEHDTTFFNEKAKDNCWFNITVKQLNAKIYCSYSPIQSRKDFDELVKDSYEMTNKHNVKASFIEEFQVDRKADHVHGVVFNVEGPAASSYQFFLTDSIKNFVRGALYFNTEARPDSLAPVVEFMREDLDRLVETLKWNQ